MIALAVGILVGTGAVLLARLLPRGRHDLFDWVVLGAPVGALFHSVGFGAWALAGVWRSWGWVVVDLLVLLGAGAVARLLVPKSQAPAATPPERRLDTAVRLIAAAALGVAVLCVGLGAATWLNRRPMGMWDAWAFWNVKSRMLYHVPSDLHTALLSEDAPHPAYPLAYPATVARLWRYANADLGSVPGDVGVACAVLVPLVLTVIVARLGNWTLGLVAGVLTCGSVYFTYLAGMQYADVPFALAAAGAVGCAAWAVTRRFADEHRWRYALLAGLLAGLAAWTKNEGLPLLVSTGLLIVLLAPARRMTAGFAFGAGTAPGLLAFAVTKFLAEKESGHVRGATVASVLERASEPQRWEHVTRALRVAADAHFDSVILGCAGAAACLAILAHRQVPRSALLASGVCAAQLATYTMIYAGFATNLPWLIETTVDRLAIHLWPIAILALILVIADQRTPESCDRKMGTGVCHV